ncbi:hypothetical protein [Cytobacillus kochii]|uniref:hypothetical protein n=1 Tax=Cytobacillus kochii TaxID=859143 RepID=UPI00203F60EB|nr:hypothetical protein [Cytobacillus kochii]MCM3324805.1 hypothetical protein [Cytobacillus kochii]MCM3347198.1 hypothetical protein [Cytobacillus kochii]
MANAPCPTYGVHRMISRGYTVAWDHNTRSKIASLIGWYRCACGERVITGGTPHFGGAILDYVTEGGIKGTAVIGPASGFLVQRSLIRNTTSSTLNGYRFYSA